MHELRVLHPGGFEIVGDYGLVLLARSFTRLPTG